ncbi:MAG: hypothetical protein IPK03_10000 [Bacteroidetes bacterium]|nr:hypothetical protein [Bacteroidota bacterium]
MRKNLAFILFSILLVSCENTQKLLKSNNTKYKYTVAMDRFNRGKYFQAVPVIEHLLPLYKGTDTGEMLYFTLAEAYFKNDEFLVAAYHYKNYRDLYSTNPRQKMPCLKVPYAIITNLQDIP